MERDDTRISSIRNVRSLCGIGYSVDSVWAGVPDILGGEGAWSWKFFIHHQRDEAVGRTLVGATIAAEGEGSHFAIISRVYLLYHGDGPVSGMESFILDKDEVVGGQTSSWSGPFAALGAGGEV